MYPLTQIKYQNKPVTNQASLFNVWISTKTFLKLLKAYLNVKCGLIWFGRPNRVQWIKALLQTGHARVGFNWNERISPRPTPVICEHESSRIAASIENAICVLTGKHCVSRIRSLHQETNKVHFNIDSKYARKQTLRSTH